MTPPPTPLFNYHYRISAPPGVNGVRLTPRGWFEFSRAGFRRLRRESWSGLSVRVTILAFVIDQDNYETRRCCI